MTERSQIRSDRWIALAIGTGTCVLLVATLDCPTFTWDEGYTIRRESLMRGWFQRLVDRPAGVSLAQFFREDAIYTFWPFAREEPDGHPPFYALIGNAGWWLSHHWLAPWPAHRFGPVLLFSFTVGVMYLFLARRFGRLAGLTAAAAWLLMPRVFAHAHLASYDVPLANLWILTAVAFWKAREAWDWSIARGAIWSLVFAVVLSCAAATKFTGWLVPLPLLVWTLAAGLMSLRREGPRSLTKLVRPIICLLLLISVIPVQLRLLRSIRETEEQIPRFAGEDSQQRARRAAAVFRSVNSGGWQNSLLFIAPAVWLVMYGSLVALRGTRTPRPAGKSHRESHTDGKTQDRETVRSRSRLSGTAETWSAAALVPALTVLLIPPWWHDPLRGVAVFLWSNLSRQHTTWIPTQFFGTVYEFSLPWYNSLAWVALTVPPPLLLLMVIGILTNAAWLVRQRSQTEANHSQAAAMNRVGLSFLLLLNAATLLIIRALPGAPGHDGERQLLGSFPFLACIAGIGAQWCHDGIKRWRTSGMACWIAPAAVGISMAWSAGAIWHYRAAPLSYYTELIGGLRGAARLGLEPTYYWDAMDRESINWLNRNTGSREKVRFCNYFDSLGYLIRWGYLTVEILPSEPGIERWYVLQNRPGVFLWNPRDRWLAEHGQPAFKREMDGVPLIWIFPFDEYERARDESSRAGKSP